MTQIGDSDITSLGIRTLDPLAASWVASFALEMIKTVYKYVCTTQ